MKCILFLVHLIVISTSGYCQTSDYKMMRSGMPKLSCKPTDSLTVAETNLALRTIDTNLIDSNLDLYYRDLGWSYYRLYLFNKDTSFITKSIENYKKADYLKPNSSVTYWQLSFLYYLLADCKSGKYYLEKYKNVTERQYWHEDQIKRMIKDCKD